MSTFRAPRPKVGSVKIVVRIPSASDLQQQQLQKQQQQERQKEMEEEQQRILLRNRVVSVPEFESEIPAAANSLLESHCTRDSFSESFLRLRFADMMPESPGSKLQRESRAKLIAKTAVEMFDAVILRVLSNCVGSADPTVKATDNSSSRDDSDEKITRLLERCVEPLLESSAMECLDAMVVELCRKVELTDSPFAVAAASAGNPRGHQQQHQQQQQTLTLGEVAVINSFGIDACLSRNALPSVATWRLEVCKVCSAAVAPIIKRVELLIRDFCVLVANELQQHQQQRPPPARNDDPPISSSSASTAAAAAANTLANIDRELLLFRRVLGAWRHGVRDMKAVLAECIKSLTTLQSFAAGEALLVQAKLLAGDAAREEAESFSCANVLHELLSRNFLNAVNALSACIRSPQKEQLQQTPATGSASADAKQKGSRRRRGGKKKEQQQCENHVNIPAHRSSASLAVADPTATATATSTQVRHKKAEMKPGAGHQVAFGRGGRGRSTPLSSAPSSPVVVDAEYSRAGIAAQLVTERSSFPQQQHQRPAMIDQHMFRPKRSRKDKTEQVQTAPVPAAAAAAKKNNRQDDDVANNSSAGGCSSVESNNLSSRASSASTRSTPDGAEMDHSSTSPASPASASPTSPTAIVSAVLASLSPAGLDRLVGVKSAEMPRTLAIGGAGASGQYQQSVISFANASREYKCALISTPYRGAAYERLASLYAQFPLAFAEQQSGPQNEQVLAHFSSPAFRVCQLYCRAASAAVDQVSGCIEKALRHMRKAARDVRRATREQRLKNSSGGKSSHNYNGAIVDYRSSIQTNVVSLADVVIAVTSHIFNPQDQWDSLSSPTSASSSADFTEQIRIWKQQLGELLVQKELLDASSAVPRLLDSDSSMLYLRLSEIVLVLSSPTSSATSAMQEEQRLCIPLALADVFCNLILASHPQSSSNSSDDGGIGHSSLPTALSLLLEAVLPEAKKVVAHQQCNSIINDDDDEDEILFVGVNNNANKSNTSAAPPSLLSDALQSLRRKMLQVRDKCDNAAAGLQRLQSVGNNTSDDDQHFVLQGTSHQYITCDDTHMFGLPADARLLIQRQSYWFAASRNQRSLDDRDGRVAGDDDRDDGDGGQKEEIRNKRRRVALRPLTKLTPAMLRLLALEARTPPHRHDETPRHYADREQTVLLRLQRLSSSVRRLSDE